MISCTKTFRKEKGKRVELVGLMSIECDEIYQALIDINDHIVVNWEEQESEQETAEEMR